METRSLYVHIPFCESICSYCDFCKVYYDQKQSDLYLQRLNEEFTIRETSTSGFKILIIRTFGLQNRQKEKTFYDYLHVVCLYVLDLNSVL